MADPETLDALLTHFERWVLRNRLKRFAGHRAKTAASLGITREGLYKKMRRLGLEMHPHRGRRKHD